MTALAPNYESLRKNLADLELPQRIAERRTLWIVDRVLGIAKTHSGSIELFLIGKRITAKSELIRRHLQHGSWRPDGGNSSLDANRLILPAEPQFLPMAALIGVELVRNGLSTEAAAPDAFLRVEPLIELALRRTALAEEHLVGLMGELLLLECMFDAIGERPELASSVLDFWRGHLTGLRDFVIGDMSIEVKTTQHQSSSHQFSGLHQVERSAKSGSEERSLHLFSIGLTRSSGDGQSLSELVQRLVDRLGRGSQPAGAQWNTLQTRFIAEVANYGASTSSGYDHSEMADLKAYSARFNLTFSPRLYDMSDRAVRIIRQSDLEGTFVSPQDLSFRLDLPAHVGPGNPEVNWQRTVTHMVRAQLGLEV